MSESEHEREERSNHYFSDVDQFSWSIEKWSSVLKLANMWDFPRIRQMAIEQIGVRTEDPIERIILAERYEIPGWEISGMNELCRREQALTLEEGERLGLRRAMTIMRAWGEVPLPTLMKQQTIQYGGSYIVHAHTTSVISRTEHDFAARLTALLKM